LWHKKDRRCNRIPKGLRGVDRQSSWGYSPHHGWVQGYSFEVVTTATKGSIVVPLLASVDTASVSEHVSFAEKIDYLPEPTKYVLADSGYDNNDFGERIEYDQMGRRTGRRFLCPANRRNSSAEPKRSSRRQQRLAFYASARGRRLYAQRKQTVEPFNEWLKNLFELDQRVWHRGWANNRTQLLAAIFCYQWLLRYNHRKGRQNGQSQWILDTL